MLSSQMASHFLSVCHRISAKGLVVGSGGNASLLCRDGILITPSGISLEVLEEKDLVLLQPDGSYTCPAGHVPTKEWKMHLACYAAREDVKAIVHVHSIHALAVACMEGVDPACALPPLTASYGGLVGALPLLPYHKPGSDELCSCVAEAIREKNALLLANHGSLAAAKTLDSALNMVDEIEGHARLHLLLGAKAVPLSPAQLAQLNPQGRWG